MRHEYDMYSVSNVVNIYAISLYLDIVMIVLKLIEILNHYVLYQELTQSCRSVKLQSKQTKQEEKRSDEWLSEVRGSRGNWMKAVKMEEKL